MTGVQRCAREDGHTGRKPCDNQGQDWRYVAANQGTPKMADEPQEAWKGLLRPQNEYGHAKT